MTVEPLRPAGRIVAYAQPAVGAALFLITSNEEKVRTQCNVWQYSPKAVLKQIAVEPAPPFSNSVSSSKIKRGRAGTSRYFEAPRPI